MGICGSNPAGPASGSGDNQRHGVNELGMRLQEVVKIINNDDVGDYTGDMDTDDDTPEMDEEVRQQQKDAAKNMESEE